MDIGKECIGLICVVSKGWCIHTGELGGPLGCQRHFSSPPRHQPSKQDVGIRRVSKALLCTSRNCQVCSTLPSYAAGRPLVVREEGSIPSNSPSLLGPVCHGKQVLRGKGYGRWGLSQSPASFLQQRNAVGPHESAPHHSPSLFKPVCCGGKSLRGK